MLSLRYGRSTIVYGLRKTDRKTLAIHVFPDGAVAVDAPGDAAFMDIEARVKKRAPWILRQQRLFASYPVAIPPQKYESGEGFRYLGRQYRLRVVTNVPSVSRSAKLKGGYLHICVHNDDESETVQKLMDAWLRKRARIVFTDLLACCTARAARIGVKEVPPFKMLRMQKRWGSCTGEGVVILNPELVAAPKVCIEYVICHELCHLRIRNHSSSFYRLLGRVLPDWESLRLKLNQSVELRLKY